MWVEMVSPDPEVPRMDQTVVIQVYQTVVVQMTPVHAETSLQNLGTFSILYFIGITTLPDM